MYCQAFVVFISWVELLLMEEASGFSVLRGFRLLRIFKLMQAKISKCKQIQANTS